MKTFRIAPVSTGGSFTLVGKSSKVTEELFYQILKNQIKLISATATEKVDEGIEICKGVLDSGSPVTVGGIHFETKGKN